MNTLVQKIQAAQKQYRVSAIKEQNHRAKVKALVLTTLLGEIENKQKNGNFTDEMAVALVKKFINGINETLAVKKSEDLLIELEALSVFLPRQMSDAEIRSAVFRIIDSWKSPLVPSDMGKVMGILKQQYGGMYDGSAAGKIVKSVIEAG